MFVSSCSDGTQEDNVTLNEKVALEVSVDGINRTKSLVTGTTLPDNSRFAIFYNSAYSIGVDYNNGLCTLDDPIFLDKEKGDAAVYAIYPYVSGIEVNIDTSESQIDYLAGVSVHDNGETFYPDKYHPHAKILFDHILARITLNIHKAATIDGCYKISDIYLMSDDANAYLSAMFLATDLSTNNNFEPLQNRHSDFIEGVLKDNKYGLETDEDVVTVDFLVIPSETTWQIYIPDVSDSRHALPSANYESGKQYIYDCLIKGDDVISIKKCDIQKWTVTDMPEIDAI